jgi:hypothetical protein
MTLIDAVLQAFLPLPDLLRIEIITFPLVVRDCLNTTIVAFMYSPCCFLTPELKLSCKYHFLRLQITSTQKWNCRLGKRTCPLICQCSLHVNKKQTVVNLLVLSVGEESLELAPKAHSMLLGERVVAEAVGTPVNVVLIVHE